MTDKPDTQPSATPEWRDQDRGADAASDRTYNPGKPQANRANMQGLGVGQTEIDQQQDPTRDNGAEQYGSGEGPARDASAEDGGAARAEADADGAESLDDVRGQSATGDA